MSADKSTKLVDEQKVGLLRRLFPARQVLVRDNDRVRQCAVSPLLQISAVFLFIFMGLWCVGASIAWYSTSVLAERRNGEIDEKLAQLEIEKNNYRQASRKIDEFQDVFSNAACEISEVHRSLSILAERGLGPMEDDAATLPKLKNDAQGCRTAANVAVAIANSGETETTEEEAIRERINRLNDELKRLRSNQAAFLTHTASVASLRINELERVLRSVNINIHTVADVNSAEIGAPQQPRFGRGGPFIALRPFAEGAYTNFTPVALFNQKATRLDDLNAAVRVLPLSEPLNDYVLTSPFGRRNDPLNFLTGIHEGVDFGAPTGTPIAATGNGRVVTAGYKDRYGYMVEIDHGMGIVTRYAHMSKIIAAIGQDIRRGDNVGLVGNTGRSTGPHLHYEVRMNGKAFNPTKFINAGRNVLAGK